ncbi:MAG TPA: 4-(cytidine 5'-diphospho)-2-C-methyl-D-erythritol kinase [Gemmatimonadaceae bacterium]
MSGAASVTAQAKVNLALRVLARERSGYHQIETLFARLDLGDEVRVRTGVAGRSLDAAGPAMPAAGLGPIDRNLAWRAAAAYAEATGWPRGFAIEIEKRIPVGGGLAGGSADAGAVLRLLDHLNPSPVGAERLLALATPLGADVPFLASEAALALGWGRGERLLALPALPPREVRLVVPPFGVATADAYAWLAASRERTPEARLLEGASLAHWSGVAAIASNDFEPVVFGRHPELSAIAARLRAAGARIALLSGSGSTVFGIFDVAPAAGALAEVGGHVLATRTATRVVAPVRSG